MKRIQPTPTETPGIDWPRHAVPSILCRKRDLVIRIADWTRDRDEPGYCVEVYIGGVYDWYESQTCRTANHPQTKAQAKAQAIAFAQAQIARLL